MKGGLSRTYETAQGRFDLYLLFFERALRVSTRWADAFITPEKFLYVETAAPLRRLLGKFQVEEIKLVDEQVFDGLVTYPTITTLANRSPEKATTIQLRDGLERQCDLGVDGTSWMPLIRGADQGPSRPKTAGTLCAHKLRRCDWGRQRICPGSEKAGAATGGVWPAYISWPRVDHSRRDWGNKVLDAAPVHRGWLADRREGPGRTWRLPVSALDPENAAQPNLRSPKAVVFLSRDAAAT